MKVIQCGTDVVIKLSDTKAMITAIEISFKSVIYKLSYFNNGEMQTAWLNENLFTTGTQKKQTIGFNK